MAQVRGRIRFKDEDEVKFSVWIRFWVEVKGRVRIRF